MKTRGAKVVDIPEALGGGVMMASDFGIDVPPGLVLNVRGLTDEETTTFACLFVLGTLVVYHFKRRHRGALPGPADVGATIGRQLADLAAAVDAFDLIARDDFGDFASSRGLVAPPHVTEAELFSWLGVVRSARQAELDALSRLAAEREARRVARLARNATPAEALEPVTCAADGCARARMFFDGDGVGYCKRHGNERGLRPSGKVT